MLGAPYVWMRQVAARNRQTEFPKNRLGKDAAWDRQPYVPGCRLSQTAGCTRRPGERCCCMGPRAARGRMLEEVIHLGGPGCREGQAAGSSRLPAEPGGQMNQATAGQTAG